MVYYIGTRARVTGVDSDRVERSQNHRKEDAMDFNSDRNGRKKSVLNRNPNHNYLMKDREVRGKERDESIFESDRN
jgi:hypothetical protein